MLNRIVKSHRRSLKEAESCFEYCELLPRLQKQPNIVLEAKCDYNLWFWHVACGFSGTMNDINIWGVSITRAIY
eukprot:scaffold83149_cov57-Attheya_sp.AAC.2